MNSVYHNLMKKVTKFMSFFATICFVIILSSSLVYALDMNPIITQIDSTNFPTITAYLSILDARDQPIAGLTKDQIELMESGVNISNFEINSASTANQGTSVVLALDTSGSMAGKPMENAKRSALAYINRMSGLDQIAIISFDDEARRIQSFTNDKSLLTSAVNSLKAEGKFTVLNDAIYDAISIASTIQGKKAVIALSDGKDEGSKVTLDDCIRQAKEYNIPIYTIGFGSQVEMNPLGRISKLTGGRDLFAPKSSDLMGLYINISEQLKKQYIIQYASPSRERAGASLNLIVKINQNGIIKQHEKGFLIPSSYQASTTKPEKDQDKPNILLLALIGVGFIALLAVLIFVILNSKKKTRKIVCPTCGREMDPGWNECLFCKGEKKSQAGTPKTDALNRRSQSPGNTIIMSKKQQKHLAYLIVKEGANLGKQYQIKEREMTIGRDATNDISIDDRNLSRNHAKIRLIDGSFVINDLATTNGTFVNGERSIERRLSDGDEIKLGQTVLVFKQIES